MSQSQTQSITLDGETYAVSDLSEAALKSVQSLIFAEARLRELQNEVVVHEAAHYVFLQGLKVELAPKSGKTNA